MPTADSAHPVGGGGTSSSSSMYPLSPSIPGLPPPGVVDSSPDRGPPHQFMGAYSYGPPPAYSGGPPHYHPHHPPPHHHPMTPLRVVDKSGQPIPPPYGPYHGPPHQQSPYHYGGGGGYMPPYGGYGGSPVGGPRGPPWMSYDIPPGYGGYPSQHSAPVRHNNTSSGGPPQHPLSLPSNNKLVSPQHGEKAARGVGLKSSSDGKPTSPMPNSPNESRQRVAPPSQQQQQQNSGLLQEDPVDSSRCMNDNPVDDLPGIVSAQTPVLDSESPQTPPRHEAVDEFIHKAIPEEFGMDVVKPIQTDFHFFVQDRRPTLLKAATLEVDKSLVGKDPERIEQHRAFLINSNLNCRVLKEWEDLPRDEREEYFKKEEDDRQRFMEDDEVASRHCFTLTARVRSPSKTKNSSLDDSAEEGTATGSPIKTEATNTSALDYGEEEGAETGSAIKIEGTNIEAIEGSTDGVTATTKIEETGEFYPADVRDDEKLGKRLSDNTPANEESPSKKNKGEDDIV